MPTTLVLNRFNNYVTDDAAQVGFGCKYDLNTKRDKYPDGPPTKVMVVDAMRGGKLEVSLDRLTYRHTIKGGIRNPDASIRYTTDHQTFHIYTHSTLDTKDDPEIVTKLTPDGDVQFNQRLDLVIVSVNGAGERWLMINYCDQGNSVLYAAQAMPQCIVHDLLHSIFLAYGMGYRHGSSETTSKYKQAFVDGRLKKRKDRGQDTYKVFIEDKPIDPNGPVVIKVGRSGSAWD